jgi:type IX secretion system PorP/SprF family membrane protein
MIILLFLSGVKAKGQDMHFFHFRDAGPLLSPAEAGQSEGKYRFSGGYRSQWASVSNPYLSSHFSLDGKTSLLQKAKLGWGLTLYQDKAGDAAYGSTGALMHLSIRIPLAKKQSLVAGASGGIMERSFDRSKLYFDEQYNGSIFDPGIAALDISGSPTLRFPDIAFGITYIFRQEWQRYEKYGFVLHHPHQPVMSHFEDQSAILKSRWTLYHTSSYILRPDLFLQPGILLMKQGPQYEVLFGAWISRYFSQAFPERITLDAGLFTRAGDALILGIGGSHSGWNAAMSYEINYSGLKAASAWRGGWELSLGYQLHRLAPALSNRTGCLIL